jgi:transglutaminase-like putative cysteine protease
MTERVFHISHTTTYAFDRPVDGLTLTTRLHPPLLASQRLLHSEVRVTPHADAAPDTGTDGVRTYTIRQPTDRLKVTGQTTLAHAPAGFGPGLPLPPPSDTEPEAEAEAHHPLIADWARETLPETDPDPNDIRRFAARVHRDFVFDRTATSHSSSLIDFFTGCRGVCEDYVRLAIACLRTRGVPVRHVVGYLLPVQDQDSRFGRHAHAWISVWRPGTGWIDLDPTTGLVVPERHVTLARGLGRDDTLPVSGRFADGQCVGQRVSVDVSIVNA